MAVESVPPLDASAVLTHPWLVRVRGGEKVLAAIRSLVPAAPIYTLVHDPAGIRDLWATDPTGLPPPVVLTSFLQRIPGATRRYPMLLPLMPHAARRLRLPAADLVVCSDAAVAKAMTPDPRSRVVCYCNSPMRYIWEPQIAEQYAATLPAPLRPLWRPLSAYLRRVDRAAADRVGLFLANSRHVAERIRRAYERESLVVHPGVQVPIEPLPPRAREPFFLCVGYHAPYKRLDLAVAACRALDRRLVVIGEGPDVARLRADAANAHVEWLGWQPDAVVHDHLQRATALLFPGEEDFGIVPVEALAHGCPVVAFGVGGACETITDGRTGVLFREPAVESLIEAIRRSEAFDFDPHELYQHALPFGRSHFLTRMHAILSRIVAGERPETLLRDELATSCHHPARITPRPARLPL
ncbi:MAG: glycosyltransferase [Phycisphaerae bacterium]